MSDTLTAKIMETWVRCFKVTLKTKRAYKARLQELETWDKPGNGSSLTEREHAAKVLALKHLLL